MFTPVSHPIRVVACLLCLLPLGSCDLFSSVSDRLLTIDYHHIKFKASTGTSPALHDTMAAVWRAQVRSIANAVAQSVSSSNVYGDRTLWDPLLTAAVTEATHCQAKNTDSKSLKIRPGSGQLDDVQIVAVSGDLTHEPIPNQGPCDVIDARKLRTVNIQYGAVTEGQPQSSFTLFEVRLGPTSNDVWTPTDLSTLSATFEPGPEKGAAQFAALLVLQDSGWQGDFEEAIVITRGSYFGDVKVN